MRSESDIQNKSPRERILLGSAVLGLSVMTVLVLVATYYFVASFLVGWQAEPGVVAVVSSPTPTSLAVMVEEVVEVETAVMPTPSPHPTSISHSPHQITPTPSFQSVPVTTAVPTNMSPPDTQTLLIIPSLGVSQEITEVPIVNGEWMIDDLGSQVGLLDSTGTHPGDDYAMAFIGHVTRPWPEISGPFADLILLEHGEEVIYRANGTDYVYQVERIFRANPQAVDLLYVPNGEKIVLVTCSGWDFVDREYDERLVTRAVLVRTEPSPTAIQ